MKVRLLDNSEKKEIMSLYEEVFEDSDAYLNYFYENILPSCRVFSCTANEEPAGMLCLIPKNITVGDRKITAHYIYGVATKAKWRRKGVMSAIMNEAVNHLYLNRTDDYFTYLIPVPADNASIYERFGFGAVMDRQCMTDKLCFLYAGDDTRSRLCDTACLSKKRATRSDIGRLSEYAQRRVGESYEVYLTKDRDYFENMLSLMEAEGGGIDIYFAEKETARKADNITVGTIVGYRTGFDDETVEEIYDGEFHAARGCDGKDGDGSKDIAAPYVMARILNVSKMIPLMRTVGTGEVIVNVKDTVISGNNGTFLWRYGGGTDSFEKMSSSDKAAFPENVQENIVDVGIGELASHIFGYGRTEGLPEMSVKKGVFINDYI